MSLYIKCPECLHEFGDASDFAYHHEEEPICRDYSCKEDDKKQELKDIVILLKSIANSLEILANKP